MDLGAFFIFLVIFGIIGFIVQKLFGWNPYTIYGHIGSLILFSSIILLFIPIIFHLEDINGNINRVTTFFVNVFPGEVIGEIAGSFIASLTRNRR